MAAHNELGNEGEVLAVKYLRSKGHEILHRNFRFKKAEVDIISRDPRKMIVFTEVKSRSSNVFGFPESFVSKQKQRLMHSAANHFLTRHNLDEEIRFDIVAVTFVKGKHKVHHVKDAFYMV